MHRFLNVFLKGYFLIVGAVYCIFVLSSCEEPKPTQPTQSKPTQPKGYITYEDEPYFKEQWYLYNEGDIHINVVPVWKQGYGMKPISVGIVDDAIDIAHPDLTDNVLVEGLNPYDSKRSHGTKVAGLLAARDNGKGIIGVAPQAKIYSYDRSDGTALNIMLGALIDIFSRPEHREIAVYNNSYGSVYLYIYLTMSSLLEKAFDTATQQGFNGKGSSIVFAAGNNKGSFGYFIKSSVNDHALRHHAVITVNSIPKDGKMRYDIGSSEGVNIWITAPSGRGKTSAGDYEIQKMITTDTNETYGNFGNTSASASLVSGAIALLRSEYPALT